MNKKMITYVMGRILMCEAALLLPPLVVALIYAENTLTSFLVTIGVTVACGLLLLLFKPKDKTIYARDGLVIVALSWIFMSLFGALPFYLTGEIPRFIDALFETVSGFTTTGSSILTDVEAMSKSLLFWRSFTHWVGGMGVLVFVMAILPLAGGGGNLHLMKAESPGPSVGKLVPKSNQTARILYLIYIVLTLLCVIFLLFGGMLGTSVSCTVAFENFISAKSEKAKSKRSFVVIISCVLCFFLSLAGFSDLIGFIYPVFGYLGFAALVLILVNYFRCKSCR
jgi:trk system potassium uptake protein TrkH